jgi:hypothetical protein
VTQSNYVPKTQIALNEGLSIFRLKFLSLIFRTFSKKEKPRQVAQGESGGVVLLSFAFLMAAILKEFPL